MSIERIIKLEDVSNVRITDVGVHLEMKICLYDYKYVSGEYTFNTDSIFKQDNMFKCCYIANTPKDIINITESYQTRFYSRKNISKIETYFIVNLPSIYDTVAFNINHIHGKDISHYKDNKITVYLVVLDNNQSFFIFYVEDITITRKDKLMRLKERIVKNKLQSV